MTDATPVPVLTSREKVAATLKRRYRAELRFRAYGLSAVLIGIMCVVFLFWTIIQKGYTAFEQTYIQLDVAYSAQDLDPAGRRSPDDLQAANYQLPVRAALRAAFPQVEGRSELKKLYGLVSGAAEQTLRDRVLANPRLIGQRDNVWVLADDRVDMLAKGKIDRSLPESDRALDDMELRLFDALKAGRHVEVRFNSPFFTSGDSREPEQAGVLGALVGTLLTLLVTLVISFPIGVAAAVYLEEFARRNRLTDLIEVNINNLAAVPSIVFGLLGLAMFIQFFGRKTG